MLASLTLLIAVVGLDLVWVVYRFEHRAARLRSINDARARLIAVREAEPWLGKYFTTLWTPEKAKEAAERHRDKILKREYELVLEVPPEPLVSLVMAAGGGDLLLDKTVRSANVALWHIRVFNQLVRQHTDLLRQHLAEIVDRKTSRARLGVVARTVGAQAGMLHERGVGEANGPQGWYRTLRKAVRANLAHLGHLENDRFSYRERSGWRFAAGDAAALMLVLAAVTLVAWRSFNQSASHATCRGAGHGDMPYTASRGWPHHADRPPRRFGGGELRGGFRGSPVPRSACTDSRPAP